MHTEVEMTLTVSLLLDEMVNILLNKVEKNEAGDEVTIARTLPFRLKYRLTRNKATLDKDYRAYQQKQLMLMAKYGELTADGEHFEIKDPEKFELYKGEMEAALSTIVKHSVVKLDPEDLENLLEGEDIQFNEGMLKTLLGYLVDDQAFLDDITTEIRWHTYTPTEKAPGTIADTVAALNEATKTEEAPNEAIKTEEVTTEVPEVLEASKPKKTKSQKKRTNIIEGKPILEGLTEEPKVEEVPKAKKAAIKKTSKVKETTTKKTTTKKTTATKTATKKAAAKDKTNE